MPLSVGLAAFLVMATWRWGRKATFAAYAARSNLTMADVVALHRASTTFLERNAVIMAPVPLRHPGDRAPRSSQLLWERYGVLPRNMILVEVTHPKVPYIHENRYHMTVFDRDKDRGSVIGVELRFGFMEEPNVERYLERHGAAQEDRPADHPRQWIVHVSHENMVARQADELCSNGCVSACFCSCGWSLAPPIMPMASAMKCSSPPRSCRSGCDKRADPGLKQRWTLVSLDRSPAARRTEILP